MMTFGGFAHRSPNTIFQQLAVHERFFLVRDLIDGDDRRD
jgi:hypothetical protein